MELILYCLSLYLIKMRNNNDIKNKRKNLMNYRKFLVNSGLGICLGLLAGCETMKSKNINNDRSTARIDITGGIDLDGAKGNIFRVNPGEKSFELLKETAFDPKTNEGRSRHKVFWKDKTVFTKVIKQNNFEGLKGDYMAYLPKLNDKNADNAKNGNELVIMRAIILAPEEDGKNLPTDKNNLLVPFKPAPKSHKFRGGSIVINGKNVPVRLRGPRAKVDIRKLVKDDTILKGFWGAKIRGKQENDRFVVDQMDIFPRLDPREVDDPKLPRILVVGDSISMNYHQAAKKALSGIANYYRVEGNGGPSDRGVTCMDLWLGDYTQPGLQWDVIQFNHGLHDLKQEYDEETGKYGAYQVPIEEYKANLEKEIKIMKKTGAELVWCSTTPVPNNSYGTWDTGTFGRKKGAAELYNKAALEVIRKYPEIRINDLHSFITKNEKFDKWRKQKDVHYWDRDLQEIVGQAVADRLIEVLKTTDKK